MRRRRAVCSDGIYNIRYDLGGPPLAMLTRRTGPHSRAVQFKLVNMYDIVMLVCMTRGSE